MKNALNWFEIPVADIQRAVRFYNAVLGVEMAEMEVNPGYPMAVFPSEDGVGGALVQGEGYAPSSRGTIIYLTYDGDLSQAMGRVDAAGGRVLMPKTPIGETGFAAYLLDTEGNKVGLHSLK